MKKILVLLLSIFVLFSCSNNEKIVEEWEKINIASSIIPLSSIANYIWGDYVNVNTIIPAGVSPHWYDLKINDQVLISDSDIVLFLWLDHIDSFMEKALNNKEYIKLEEYFELIEKEEEEHEEEDEEDHEWHDHSTDPHVWTSAWNAIIIWEKIKDKLILLSEENKNYFEENFESFKTSLEATKNDFITKNDSKEVSPFIVFHDAYNYLFEELGVEEWYKYVLKPNVLSEMSIKDNKDLRDNIVSKNIKIIYREPQFKDKSIYELSSEYWLDVYILDPLGTDDSAKWYIENYKSNLSNLESIYEWAIKN